MEVSVKTIEKILKVTRAKDPKYFDYLLDKPSTYLVKLLTVCNNLKKQK